MQIRICVNVTYGPTKKKNFTAPIASNLWGDRRSQLFLKRMRITMTSPHL